MGGIGPLLGQAHHFRLYAPEKPAGQEAAGRRRGYYTADHTPHMDPQLTGEATDDQPVVPDLEDGGCIFCMGESRFRYDRLGLRRV